MLLVKLIADVANADTAIAANGCVRYTFGAVFPLFTLPMYQNLGIHWSGSVFAFLSLGLLPIPWLLFKYGPTLRKSSRFAVTAKTADDSTVAVGLGDDSTVRNADPSS